MCGAVRLGMRRLIVAHSDEQGSAESQSRVVRVHARDGRRVVPKAAAPCMPYNEGMYGGCNISGALERANGMFGAFDELVSVVLNGVWHKQCISL